jgi:hypothetical protein
VSLARAIAAAALVLTTGGLLWALFVEPPPEPAPARSFESSQQCADCHAEVFAEWQDSWHAQAWTDPEVRAQSNDFQNADCIDCHAPRPILETGLGQRVLPRSTRRVEGVDCIACHQLPDGRMAGTIDSETAACRPRTTRELLAPEYCAGCHDQHGTVQQWRASRFAVPGPEFKNCIDCHMPYRDGDPARGRNHLMHGGHDPELVRSAVVLRGERSGAGWAIEVENVGAGHNFPTDERSRASDLFWRPLGSDGPWRHLYRFRNPYRFEVGIPNTELPSGQVQRVELADADAAGGVEVALFYKLTPRWADEAHPDPEREATLVHRVELRP